jgi:hypothetical protein
MRAKSARQARAPGNAGIHSTTVNADVNPFDANAYGRALNCSFTGDN